ncbi:Na(+)/H(+) exchange regulatory cofactor NHE-RF1 [Trichogramma pretiosum]|uniref:Na(+)/H(+) exchange regulatory cofactor NHE-RF1 n=1 Tax=Trichogramma pretiosum TaxID=7493 RepID=UPI0006C944F0|nr:Na(+)/H(+) exchange regulatory cofactor NHE-RF1 [Trichogramma pretiosum]
MEHQIREQQLPCARLCHIIKWEDFDGYGFNLHAEKGRQGQFIGKVDEGSPSEAAGLRKGDRIIEVNDVNITGETHKQVVERIKSLAGETRLLVVDQQADEYFKTNNMPIKGSMPGIRKLRTPDKSPHQLLQEERDAALAAAAAAANNAAAAPNKHRNGHQNSSMNSDSLSNDSSDHHHHQHHSIHDEYGNGTSRMIQDEDATSVKSSVSGNSKHEQQSATTTMSSPSQLDLSVTDSPSSGAGTTTTTTTSTTLNLGMSAKELRAKLAQRKKYDPKKESLNFKDKFDIVQKL